MILNGACRKRAAVAWFYARSRVGVHDGAAATLMLEAQGRVGCGEVTTKEPRRIGVMF